jgi:broad specificity phosphatase PhoE
VNTQRTLLLLIRHGETEWNSSRRYQGHTDVHLNDHGRWQAQQTADRLASAKIDAIYSSDLTRSRECADAIAMKHNLAVTVWPELRERCFGTGEGMTREEAKQCEWWIETEESDGFLSAPGGENRGEFRARIVACVARIAEQHPGQTVAIVTHGGPIGQIVCDILGAPANVRTRLRVDNCSLSLVSIEPERRLVLMLNDVSHIYPDAPVAAIAAIERRG